MQRKLQEITGLRKKDLVILVASLLVGGLIVGGNFLHYQSVQDRYSTSFSDSPEELTITGADPMELSFDIQNPDRMETVRVSVVFRDVSPGTSFTFTVNDDVTETATGFRPGGSHLITLSSDQLQEENTLEVSGRFDFSTQATVQSVKVRGVTGLQRITFLLLNIIGIIIVIGPILIVKYMQYSRRAELEEEFPNFLRDVVEGTRAGMPLPQAIQNTRSNSYGQLTPYVRDMAAKLEWGI
ncbi:MAG: hypothetical protein SVU88_00420, partial [Candidatus Nanohaloarchaea archaeon]|nr:hypothetical protein [Candidatus Nanohaloarchaea archaeon]